MKNLIIIIAFLMLLKPVLPVVSYMANYEYIVKELCENKAKPQMHCSGKCHLMKELAKAAEQEKPLSEKKSVHTEAEVLFCQAVTHYTFACYNTTATKQNLPVYSNLYSNLNCNSVFHPPLVIS